MHVTTRKRLISGALVLAMSGVLIIRHYYHATAKGCATANMKGAPLQNI
jgi:hypothetical protein